MYKLLDLYATAYDKDFPVVCMDEKSKQLIIDTRKAIPLKPGGSLKRFTHIWLNYFIN